MFYFVESPNRFLYIAFQRALLAAYPTAPGDFLVTPAFFASYVPSHPSDDLNRAILKARSFCQCVRLRDNSLYFLAKDLFKNMTLGFAYRMQYLYRIKLPFTGR